MSTATPEGRLQGGRPGYIVFGAAGGIGSELCRAAAVMPGGADFVLAGRTEGTLRALAEELKGLGGRAEAAVVDATVTGEVERVIAEGAAQLGRADGIANCVGSIVLKPAHLTTDEELERTLRLNLWSAFAVVRGAAKVMRANGGSVVLFSTAAARCGMANHDAIAAAKAGVIGLTLSAAATYAANGIRVNCVAPGLVDTPLAAGITGNEGALKASVAMHALGRVGTPKDVGPLAAWLLSGQSAWVTGQVFGVDGGLATVRPRLKM